MSDKRMKAGSGVSFQRRNGAKAAGRIQGLTKKANGLWVTVYTGTSKRAPAPAVAPADFTNVRPSELTYI